MTIPSYSSCENEELKCQLASSPSVRHRLQCTVEFHLFLFLIYLIIECNVKVESVCLSVCLSARRSTAGSEPYQIGLSVVSSFPLHQKTKMLPA